MVVQAVRGVSIHRRERNLSYRLSPRAIHPSIEPASQSASAVKTVHDQRSRSGSIQSGAADHRIGGSVDICRSNDHTVYRAVFKGRVHPAGVCMTTAEKGGRAPVAGLAFELPTKNPALKFFERVSIIHHVDMLGYCQCRGLFDSIWCRNFSCAKWAFCCFIRRKSRSPSEGQTLDTAICFGEPSFNRQSFCLSVRVSRQEVPQRFLFFWPS